MDYLSHSPNDSHSPSGEPFQLHPQGMAVKRLVDLVIACGMLIVCLPVFVTTAVLIKLDSAGPVFFRQERVGLYGRLFRIFKFRTMVVGAANIGTGLVSTADDPRTTRLTRFLRKYRIDELPQLFNVLRGQMSLVGPRPLVPLHADAWTTAERKRTWMRPGITGWQQVCGERHEHLGRADRLGNLVRRPLEFVAGFLNSGTHPLDRFARKYHLRARWARGERCSRPCGRF